MGTVIGMLLEDKSTTRIGHAADRGLPIVKSGHILHDVFATFLGWGGGVCTTVVEKPPFAGRAAVWRTADIVLMRGSNVFPHHLCVYHPNPRLCGATTRIQLGGDTITASEDCQPRTD